VCTEWVSVFVYSTSMRYFIFLDLIFHCHYFFCLVSYRDLIILRPVYVWHSKPKPGRKYSQLSTVLGSSFQRQNRSLQIEHPSWLCRIWGFDSSGYEDSCLMGV
jgi:hypothetical protein